LKELEVNSYPTSFIVGKDGNFISHVYPIPQSFKKAEEKLRQLTRKEITMTRNYN
jgi:hypothetical protein